jgi:hypothetical protein
MSIPNYSIPNPPCCIVGFGIAGQLLLLELLQQGVNPRKILIIDKNFLGGDLALQYPTVISNTKWEKTAKALEKYGPAITGNAKYAPTDIHPVSEISRACLEIAWKLIREHKIDILSVKIQSAEYISSQGWFLHHPVGKIQTQLLFMTQGATPKSLPLDLPSLPLSLALNFQALENLLTAKDTVVVFGTAHSGTIILKHLHTLQIPTIAIYNDTVPFRFARDGVYGGIKEGSEAIADAILRGEYTNLQLIPYNNTIEVYKALKKATYVISAIGFETRQIPGIPINYSPQTAALGDGTQNIFGFGIAYPGVTVLDGQTHTDVSVSSFQEQIHRCLRPILEQNKDFLELSSRIQSHE